MKIDGLKRRARAERGASLAEAAFALPLVFMLMFGAAEAAHFYRAHLMVSVAATDGARAASAAGRYDDADFRMLEAINRAAGSAEFLDFIVIYRPNKAHDGLPPGCAATSIPGVCNRYTPDDLALQMYDAAGAETGHFGCGPRAVDSAWCPADRESSLEAGPDYIAVHIEGHYESISGFVGDGDTVINTVTMRIEPER